MSASEVSYQSGEMRDVCLWCARNMAGLGQNSRGLGTADWPSVETEKDGVVINREKDGINREKDGDRLLLKFHPEVCRTR